MPRDMDDRIALTYAGAYQIEIRKRSVPEVAVMLNDRRCQQQLLGQLLVSSAWRNEWAPWLRLVHEHFRKIGYERRNRVLRRLLPGLEIQEVMEIDRDRDGDARSMVKTPRDSLATLDFNEQFFLLLRAIVRRYAEKRDETREAFRSVEQGLGRLNSAMGGLMAPLAALTSAAGFGALIKGQIDLGDQLSKTSQKLGIAVEDLSAYQYAAKLSDVSNEQLTSGLSRLAKAMQEAATSPTSQAGAAFRALGVVVTDAAGNLRPLNTVLEEVSQRFEQTRDGTNKTAMAMQLFGKSGTELVPLLNNLRGLSDEARRTGNIVSTDFAKKSEQFKDSLTRLESSAGNLARTISGPLVTALSSLAERMAVSIGAQEKLSVDLLKKDRDYIESEYKRLTGLSEKGLIISQKRVSELKAQMDGIDKQIAESEAKAKASTAVRPEMASISGQGVGDREAEQTAKYQQELTKQFIALQASLVSKEEAERIDHENKIATLTAYYGTEQAVTQAHKDALAILEEQHAQKVEQIRAKSLSGMWQQQFAWQGQMNQLLSGGYRDQLAGVAMGLGQMSQLMLANNKKQFEIGKKAAIGQALINTYLGVSQALSYGFPMGLVFAAIQLAVGMANVARIRSQKFGGGGGATPTFNANPGTGIPEPITNTAPEPIAPTLPQQAVTTQPRNVNITLVSESGILSAQYVRESLIPSINEAVGDGVNLRVT